MPSPLTSLRQVGVKTKKNHSLIFAGVPADYRDDDWAKKYPDYMEKNQRISFKGTSFIAESFRRLVKHRKNTAPNIKSIEVDNSLLYEGT